MWGQVYSDVEQIDVPRVTPGPDNPARLLDFERFSSDNVLELFTLELDILGRLTPGVPRTTNFMGIFRDLDYWRFAAVEDVVSNDAYPDPGDGAGHTDIALSYGLGVNSYIVKPVEFDAFLETVASIGLYWVLTNRVPQ